MKTESNLWKKEPNSIYLTAEYRGINNVLLTSISNSNKMIATLINRYNAENKIDKNVIFLSSVTSLRCGGKNNTYNSPWKANKLLVPKRNVELKPLPKIGNTFSNVYSPAFPKKRTSMLDITKGKINKLLLYNASYFKLHTKTAPIKNSIIRKNVFVFG